MRRVFRYALSAFLDQVAIELAGGAGVEAALWQAAEEGDSWAFDLFRQALALAGINHELPWDALARLGQEVGVAEVEELAATLSLAGSEGAKVRASVEAKAAAIRQSLLSAERKEAKRNTVLMTLAVAAVAAGYCVYITWPQLARVIQSP
jgi:Flp pilus assembly protein TadB